jgi:hypothetical protein
LGEVLRNGRASCRQGAADAIHESQLIELALQAHPGALRAIASRLNTIRGKAPHHFFSNSVDNFRHSLYKLASVPGRSTQFEAASWARRLPDSAPTLSGDQNLQGQTAVFERALLAERVSYLTSE